MSKKPRPLTQLEQFAPTTRGHAPSIEEVETSSPRHLPSNLPVLGEKRSTVQDKVSHQAPERTRPGRYNNNGINSGAHRIKHQIRTFSQMPYRTLMALDQAGPAAIGYDESNARALVAIKRVRAPNRTPSYQIPRFTSDHLVTIVDMYLDGEDIVFIYEAMDISLRQMTGVSSLQGFQIAAVCKEVTAGLSYLHAKLSTPHGMLRCDTILLNGVGKVKIGTITGYDDEFRLRFEGSVGEALLRDATLDQESKRSDIRSLGGILLELMEPATFILDPESVVLRSPERWCEQPEILDFLVATHNKSLESLKEHKFLARAGNEACLVPNVFRAVREARM